MYDIEGALRRRALAERLEALSRGHGTAEDDEDLPPVGGPPVAAPGGYAPEPPGPAAPPPGPAAPPPGPAPVAAGPETADLASTWPETPASRYRTAPHEGSRRHEPSRPPLDPTAAPPPSATASGRPGPVAAAPGGLPPSPYMTPASPAAPPGYAPAYGSLSDLPATALPPVAPPAARRPAVPLPSADGIPGATVAVTVVPGTPLPTRPPGRSGAGRVGLQPAAAPVPPAVPLAPPAAPEPAAPSQERPAPDPADAAGQESGSPADASAHTPELGTAASAIADLLRQGSSSLFFKRDATTED